MKETPCEPVRPSEIDMGTFDIKCTFDGVEKTVGWVWSSKDWCTDHEEIWVLRNEPGTDGVRYPAPSSDDYPDVSLRFAYVEGCDAKSAFWAHVNGQGCEPQHLVKMHHAITRMRGD